MVKVSADLNELSNPRIFGSNTQAIEFEVTVSNPLYSRVIVEDSTTGIAIYITPVTINAIDASATNTANSSVYSSILAETGLVAIYNDTTKRIEITGDLISDYTEHWGDYEPYLSFISTLIFVYSGGSESQTLAFSVNESMFSVAQIKCTSCIDLAYLDTVYDYQNPFDDYGLGQTGEVDYQYLNSNNVWLSMGIGNIIKSWSTEDIPVAGSYGTAIIRYCFCDIAGNVKIRAIRTCKDLTTCDAPIIYQSISTVFAWLTKGLTTDTISLLPFKPEVTYGESFNCCISVTDSINVEIVSILPLPANPTPHQCEDVLPILEYTLYHRTGEDLDEVIIADLKDGTIVVSGLNVVGTTTTFTTDLVKGTKIYTSEGVLIGVVNVITDDTHLTLITTTDSYSGTYKALRFFYEVPDLDSSFTYSILEKGSYTLNAKLCNCCVCITKTWDINICDSYILTTGNCNNPKINNISSSDYVKFTLKTYNSNNIVDSVSQAIILKDVLVSPLSEYQIPKLIDGFYQIIIEVLDADANLLSSTTQVLFYDCNIKSCEIDLLGKTLGFNWCVDCAERSQQQIEYKKLQTKSRIFEDYKKIIYSYWNDIKAQQSIPDTWDIENHLQELMTYSETFAKMNKLCEGCSDNSFNGSVISTNTNCGCNQ